MKAKFRKLDILHCMSNNCRKIASSPKNQPISHTPASQFIWCAENFYLIVSYSLLARITATFTLSYKSMSN